MMPPRRVAAYRSPEERMAARHFKLNRAIMVRRTIRPFTVEVRGSRRKADAPIFSGGEQPRVAWPDSLLKDLHEEPTEVARDVVAEKPQGRILPVLTENEAPRAAPLDSPEATPDWEAENEPDAVEAAFAAETTEPPASPDEPKEAVPERRPRKARETFARGERWKARLPAAIYGMRRKRRNDTTA